MRIGFGYDIHRLARGRRLLLGGVAIPSDKGALAHSDGDVLIHACIDALHGAAGLEDIGSYYPPDDPAYRDISSRILLRETAGRLHERSLRVVNLDCTVILEQPRIRPFVAEITKNLAEDLSIREDQVSVKGKSGEGIGAVGRGLAVEAYAAALLEPRQGD